MVLEIGRIRAPRRKHERDVGVEVRFSGRNAMGIIERQ
jgi:hypothetical protein